MAEITVECKGQTCPVPLVEARKAIRKAKPGDIIIITGTHPASKKEIPMAAEAAQVEVLEVKQDGEVWTIRLKR